MACYSRNMENSWKQDLQQHIDICTVEAVATCTFTRPKDEDAVRTMLSVLTEVESKNDIEPRLFYNGAFVTPQQHLQNLLVQLEGDIYPIVLRNAPFAAIREVMCYAEYIALLRYGTTTPSSSSGNLLRLLSHFSFGRFARDYHQYAEHLTQLYRHDLVHLTSPRIKIIPTLIQGRPYMTVAGFSIESSCLEGSHVEVCSSMRNERFRANLNHLRLTGDTKVTIHIHVQSLYFDLVHNIQDWISEMSQSKPENERFSKNFLATSVKTSVKLYNKPPIDQSANKHF